MKIENITTVNSYKNSIYYIDGKGSLYKNSNEDPPMIETESHASIYFNDTMIYLISSHNGRLIATYPLSNSTFDFSVNRIENGLVYFRSGGLFDGVYGVAKIEEGSFNILVPLGELNIILLHKDLVIGYLYNNLICKDFKVDRLIWEFSLSELGFDPYDDSKYDSIKEVLGVAHGYVWVHTSAYRIIAISIESGDKKVVAEGFYVYLDAESQKIISLSSNIVAFIDTQGLVEEEKYNFLDIDPLGIGKYARVYAPLHQGDYFTFIAEKDGDYGGSRHVGLFDYTLRKLVWEYEVFTQEEINTTKNKLVPPQQLKLTEDGKRMYIKDFHNTLHIFEKE